MCSFQDSSNYQYQSATIPHGPVRLVRFSYLIIGMLTYHLAEFAILNHHRMNDTQETLIAWKEAGSTREGITYYSYKLNSSIKRQLDATL